MQTHSVVRILANTCLYLLLVITCFSQQAKQYSFTHFTSTNGLASNFVNRVGQDPYGYIWIATINGLQRYDGKRFLTFGNQPGNEQSLPANEILDFVFDRSGTFWIITRDNKIGTFDYRRFVYTEYPIRFRQPPKSFEGKQFVRMADSSIVLFVQNQGFFRIDTKTKSFKPDFTLFPTPTGWAIRNVEYDREIRKYWITCDSGIVLLNPATNALSYRGHNMEKDTMIAAVGDLLHTYQFYLNQKRQVIFCTWAPDASTPVFHMYDLASHTHRRYILSQLLGTGYMEIYGTMQQRNGRLWVFGMPFIAEYTGGIKPFEALRNEYTGEQSMKIDAAGSLFEDNQQNLWISTTNGVYMFNPDRQIFNSYTLLRPGAKTGVEGNVQATLQIKPTGDIWIGCWGTGLYFYDSSFRPIAGPPSIRPYQDHASVWDMHQHSKTGMIWICQQVGVLLVYDPKSGRTYNLAPPVFRGITIRQVTEDLEGNLFFGTQGGRIIKWSLKESGGSPDKGYTEIRRIARVIRLFTDRQGYIWAAGLNDALYRMDPKNGSIVFKMSGPGSGPVYYSGESPNDILQYNDSIFVIASGPIDILNINSKHVDRINAANGLPSNSVLNLQHDAQGVLWLAMMNGITRMNLQKRIFTFYDRRDGMSTDNFVTAGSYQMSDGKIMLCTDHNFIVFDPKNLVKNNVPPDVRITDFILNNKALSVDSVLAQSRVELDHDDNSLAIQFSSMSFNKQDKIIYYYMLEGLDKEWIQADERQQAIYNYLKPGSYVFHVKCQNGDGIQSRNVTLLNVHVNAAFYQSWWFYCLVALAGLGVLYWIDRQRVRKLMALQQVRSQIADNLHEDVNTTLGNINLLSELAKIKADRDIDKSKEFIDQINEKSKRMIEAMDDMLWSIQPENDSMEKTLERMNQYAQGLQFTYGFVLQMLIDEQVMQLKLDMNIRHEIFLIYKESIQNIARHSGAKNVVVNIDIDRSSLWMKIQDDGRGFSVTASERGRGIREMKKRAANVKGELDIQSDRLGTSVLLKLPI